ncbi:hypothetical protein ACHQM5_009588 [Ranunculus cassubicifolius]
MNMKMKVSFSVFVLLIVLMSFVNESMSATCDAIQLSPCLGAIMSATPPSSTCCGRLKSQQSCLCKYVRNPNLRRYVNSANARKVANTCRVPYPKC